MSQVTDEQALIMYRRSSQYQVYSGNINTKNFQTVNMEKWLLSDWADILATKPIHKIITFTRFHSDWRKIKDFLLISNFYASALFSYTPSTKISISFTKKWQIWNDKNLVGEIKVFENRKFMKFANFKTATEFDTPWITVWIW